MNLRMGLFMNRVVYEKNIETLRKKYPVWASKLENVKRKKRNFDVVAEQSYMDDTILKVTQNGKTLYLNGKYAPSEMVEEWIGKQGKIEDYAPIIIIGISNGEHIRRIMEQVPKTCDILIYEPSFELFRRAMEEVDLSFLFQMDIPVGVVVQGINEYEIETYFDLFISIDNLTFLKYYINGNYETLFPTEVKEFVTRLRQHMSDIEVGWNTVVRYTDINAKNIFHNLHYLAEGYNAKDLWGILPDDVPAIVVSAGPSLNKNIEDLKKAVGKACIIATDTAMKPLLNAGIVPDLFAIVDGLKPAVLFEHKDISKTAMLTMTGVSIPSMDMHKGKKFFYDSESSLEREILFALSRKEGKDRTLPNIPTGGSVATSAYSFGIQMGAKTVILVGQDLAMTGNKTHADGTFEDKMKEIDVNSGEYFEVESVDGGKVLTRGDLKLYLDWFEKYIKEWNMITTVDATEGGALIHGSKVMTLKKAVQKYCKREFNVKWHINHVKKLFPQEYQNIPLEYFEKAGTKLGEVRKKAQEGLKYYEKLEKISSKQSISEKELHKTLKKIKKINHYMEVDYMAETVNDSIKGLELALRPQIYQLQNDKKTEFADIAEQGKVMLYGITIAAEEIKTIAEDTIVAYAKQKKADEENARN